MAASVKWLILYPTSGTLSQKVRSCMNHLACDCDTICVWVHAHWLGSNSGHILSKSILAIQDDKLHWCVYKSPVK